MATTVTAAAIYARISEDPSGAALAVDRQIEDCQKRAAELGWQVAETYIDNDLSAYSGGRRPRYEDMCEDLAAGRRDGMLAWNQDRLTRQGIELETFFQLIDKAGKPPVEFVTGFGDFGSDDGQFVARIIGAVAVKESADKSRRVRRKLDEVAAAGRPHGGTRPFGYERDKITVRELEAVVIREVVARYVAGESLHSLARWLEASGVQTVHGRPWRTPTIRSLVVSPRIAGLREHRGQVVGPAIWPAIIQPSLRDKALARQRDAAITRVRSPRRYLLSGLLRCGKCESRLYSSARTHARRYVCLSGPDHGGCGHLTVVAPPVEELVTAMVLHRLDSPTLADALSGRSAQDGQSAELSGSLAADEQQLEELATLWGTKQLSSREWTAARNPIERRIADTRRQLARTTRTDALTGLRLGDALAEQWATLDLTRQARIVGTLVSHITIGPGEQGARSLDPNRVNVTWRL